MASKSHRLWKLCDSQNNLKVTGTVLVLHNNLFAVYDRKKNHESRTVIQVQNINLP